MKYFLHYIVVLILFLVYPDMLRAQKPFVEGLIVYKVSLETADKKTQSGGTYTFIVKGRQMRKELKMDNGYEDIVIFNGNTNTLYSLQAIQGKKYAIQLSTEDMENRQKKYTGFHITNESGTKNIAGYTARKATIKYQDGTSFAIYYTPDLYPGYEDMFDRLPGIKFMPLTFIYINEKGMSMNFDIEKIASEPIENFDFKVPVDYKIIPYKEYKQMSK